MVTFAKLGSRKEQKTDDPSGKFFPPGLSLPDFGQAIVVVAAVVVVAVVVVVVTKLESCSRQKPNRVSFSASLNFSFRETNDFPGCLMLGLNHLFVFFLSAKAQRNR